MLEATGVRLIALLSWFDEPPELLVTCIRGLARAGVDHLVAVDGRYALYRADTDLSSPGEYAAIILACRELGMACTVHSPTGPWRGGEVEKRTFLFALGWQVAEPGDWFWVQDADQVVVRAPTNVKARLADAPLDVAEVQMLEAADGFPMRALFRAQPITVETNHHTYVTGNGRTLWGSGELEPALRLGDVLVEHRTGERSEARQAAKLAYYAERDAAGTELGACELCGAPSVTLRPARWRMTDLGPVADWVECCAGHVEGVDVVGREALMRLGVDPDSVVIANRNGLAPV